MKRRSFAGFVKRLGANSLHKEIESRALAHHVSLKELYEGANRATSITAARRSVYLWLIEEGKSVNEVARLFDRSANGVWKLTKGASE